MEMRMGFLRYCAFFLLFLLLLLPNAFGGGFAFDGLGVKAKGMGGAFRAIADDWSAAYYNPAGYNRIKDNYISANLAIAHNRYWAEPDVYWGENFESGFHNGQDIPNKHEILNIPEASILSRFPIFGETVIGLSAMQLFDQNQSWDLYDIIPAYSHASMTEYQYDINLDAVAFQLTAARGFMEDRLSAGIGLSLLRGDLTFGNLIFRNNPMAPPISDRPYEKIPQWYKVDGYGWGFGFRGGLLYQATPKIDVGFTMAVNSSIKISGKSESEFYMGLDSSLLTNRNYSPTSEEFLFVNGEVVKIGSDFETTLDLPTSIGGGVAYKATEKLTLDLDVEMTLWSSFEGFDFEFSNFSGLKNASFHYANDSLFTTDLSVPVDWDNTIAVMLGADYKLSPRVSLRAGVSYDQSPVKEATFMPQFIDLGDKIGLNFGVGVNIGVWNLELATAYASHKDMSVAELNVGADGILKNIPADYRATNYQTLLGISRTF
jgi:long-chain fatty acid transport protein